MKYKWFNLGMAAAIGLGTICTSRAEQPAEAKSTATIDGLVVVQDVKGTAEYSYPGKSWRPLGSGKLLKAGATVRSSPSGEVTIRMDDPSNFVRVAPNTSLELVPKHPETEATQAALLANSKGAARIRSLRGKASVFENGEWREAKVNSVLSSGATVMTKEKTKMDLFFPREGLVVRMKPRTIISVRNPERAAPTDSSNLRLSVARGSVEVNHRTYLADK